MRTGRRTPGSHDASLVRLREICLSLPGTSEVASWGHPNFRTGKRTFATFEWVDDRPSIAVRLEPFDVDVLLKRPRFFATPYGRGQWVSMWADGRVNWTTVQRLVRHAHRRATSSR